MKYFVEGLSNVNSGESDVRHIGDYDSLEEAIRAAEQVVDKFLAKRFVGEMTATDLFTQYQKSGVVPFIFCDGERSLNITGFNHFKYAMSRCSELCERSQSTPEIESKVINQASPMGIVEENK